MNSIKIKRVNHQLGIITRKAPADADHPYAILNLKAIEFAKQELKTEQGFSMWIYMATNKNGFGYALSKEHFCNFACCGKAAYTNARDELMEQGYLVPIEVEGQKDLYEFREWGNHFTEIWGTGKKLEKEQIEFVF